MLCQRHLCVVVQRYLPKIACLPASPGLPCLIILCTKFRLNDTEPPSHSSITIPSACPHPNSLFFHHTWSQGPSLFKHPSTVNIVIKLTSLALIFVFGPSLEEPPERLITQFCYLLVQLWFWYPI